MHVLGERLLEHGLQLAVHLAHVGRVRLVADEVEHALQSQLVARRRRLLMMTRR